MSKKPIFVVGTPRSGTTLTAKMLGLHPRIFMPGETHYLEDIASRSEQLGDPADATSLSAIAERLYTLYDRYYEPDDQQRIEKMFPQRTNLETALGGCEDYACLLDRFMTLQMETLSKTRWGNNAPRDIFSFRKIREYFPDAKFVVCVRDIRAFLLSYQGKWTVTGDLHVERLKKLYHPVITSFLWKSSMRQLALLEREIPVTDRVIVRYEDLVSAPEATMRGICETIEATFEPSMLEVQSHNSSDEQPVDGIFSTSIDRWRTQLTAEEIAISQYIASKELAWLGYPYADVSPGKVTVLKTWLETPLALWKALHANKDVIGPIIPYLARRIGALLGVGK